MNIIKSFYAKSKYIKRYRKQTKQKKPDLHT